MACASIYFCDGFAYTSTIYALLCVLKNGRRASFFGGGADTRIVNEPVCVQAAILLRPKQGNTNHRHQAADPTRGRNLFAGGIYA